MKSAKRFRVFGPPSPLSALGTEPHSVEFTQPPLLHLHLTNPPPPQCGRHMYIAPKTFCRQRKIVINSRQHLNTWYGTLIMCRSYYFVWKCQGRVDNLHQKMILIPRPKLKFTPARIILYSLQYISDIMTFSGKKLFTKCVLSNEVTIFDIYWANKRCLINLHLRGITELQSAPSNEKASRGWGPLQWPFYLSF